MRFASIGWMVALSLSAAACGVAAEEPALDGEGAAPEVVEEGPAPQSTPLRERWCNSYKTPRYCPKSVCVWHTSPAPGYCGLPLAY